MICNQLLDFESVNYHGDKSISHCLLSYHEGMINLKTIRGTNPEVNDVFTALLLNDEIRKDMIEYSHSAPHEYYFNITYIENPKGNVDYFINFFNEKIYGRKKKREIFKSSKVLHISRNKKLNMGLNIMVGDLVEIIALLNPQLMEHFDDVEWLLSKTTCNFKEEKYEKTGKILNGNCQRKKNYQIILNKTK